MERRRRFSHLLSLLSVPSYVSICKPCYLRTHQTSPLLQLASLPSLPLCSFPTFLWADLLRFATGRPRGKVECEKTLCDAHS